MRMIKELLIFLYEKVYMILNTVVLEIKYFYVRFFYKVQIMNKLETIQYIKDNNCSIARFGDGEFGLAFGEWEAGFQSASIEIQSALLKVLSDNSEKLLICIPYYFNSMKGAKKETKKIWKRLCKNKDRQKRVISFLKKNHLNNYIFGDALVTRPYIDYIDVKGSILIFQKVKTLWDNRNILIVEGENTCLGIGNDLFDNCASIKRIICPSKNAFDYRKEIKNAVISNYNNELVLLALGPTATIIAADLSKYNIQALDVGHIDIEYEWFKRNAPFKIPIEGKYTNEAGIVGQTVEKCLDEVYLKQIIAQIGC